MLLKIAYLLVRRIFGLAILVFRGDQGWDVKAWTKEEEACYITGVSSPY
jgi:hypothetical protein